MAGVNLSIQNFEWLNIKKYLNMRYEKLFKHITDDNTRKDYPKLKLKSFQNNVSRTILTYKITSV